MNETVNLFGVPETMLQTVYARAKETRTRGAIHDDKAVELVEKLHYDFSLADKDAAMSSGVIARTIVLDHLVQDYLAAHSGAVVVNIACGLDTRCYRMQGYTNVRARLLPENGAISQIAQSAMEDWSGEIAEKNAPTLVIMEGLTMYLTQTDVQQIFAVIAKCFGKATVFVEIMNPSVVKHMKEKSIEGSHAKFTWGVRGGAELQALLPGFTCTGEHCLVEGMAEFMPIYKVLGKLPAARSISNKIVLLEKSAK